MIELKNVYKSFVDVNGNSIEVLKNINFNIKEGELVVLKGSSGSGKSTILSLIASLNKPTSGEVVVDNQRVSKLVDRFASRFRQQSIGFVFQKYNLLANLSVFDNIIMPLVPSNLSREIIESKAAMVLEMFHIGHKKHQLVRSLSGGEQQRVAIARANINNPKIIIADEPTANLDEKLSLHFIEILRELKLQKKSILVATHDPLFFNLDIVDRIITIEHGELL